LLWISSSKELVMENKILVVDDDDGLRGLYRAELEDEGYEVVTAIDGREALQKLEKEKPDLVVLDIVMPKMDGMEALGRILRKNRRIPVILHSARSVYQEDFMSWAADAYLLKSANLTQLKEKMRDLLDKKRNESNSILSRV